jgi:hypothetical protein
METMRRLGFLSLGFATLVGAVGCAAPMATQASASAAPTTAGPSPSGADLDGSASFKVAPQPMAEMPSQPPPMPVMDSAPPPPPVSAQASMGRLKSSAPSSAPRAEYHEPAPTVPENRPGLGTQWGETRTSRISMVSFERADTGSPFSTAALFYNDDEGARAMAGASGFRRTPAGMFTVAGGLVSVGLRDESGRFFTGFSAGGRNYSVGESGHRYTIVLRNNTNFRLEAVLSVDGLDVLDGKAAAFAKRGYIMDPRAELEIDGFRQSMDAVAAFRFGSVRGSYAGQKTGDTRNVGVIGLALFNEVGTNPVPWSAGEVDRRRDANPFPGQFATPP